MAKGTILPDADFDDGVGWTAVGGSEHWDSVAPARGVAEAVTHDDDSTYVSTGTGGAARDFAVRTSDLPPNFGDLLSVDAVYARARFATGSADTFRIRYNYNGTDGFSAEKTLGAAYEDHTEATPSRPGGGSWASVDFTSNLVRAGAEHKFNSAAGERVTSVWWEISYAAQSGGFALFCSLWLPPIMASGLFGANLLHERVDVIYDSFRALTGGRCWPSMDEVPRLIEQMKMTAYSG